MIFGIYLLELLKIKIIFAKHKTADAIDRCTIAPTTLPYLRHCIPIFTKLEIFRYIKDKTV